MLFCKPLCSDSALALSLTLARSFAFVNGTLLLGWFLSQMHLSGYLEPQSVQANESCRIILIVRLSRICLHGGDFGVVKAQGGLASGGDDVAFVEFDSHAAGNMFL